MRTLNFTENKVEYLTLDELKQTINEHNTGSKPFNGILHTEFYDRTIDILERNRVNYVVDNIAATDSKNRIMPGVSVIPAFEAQYGKGALETHLLRRVFGKITFPDYADEGHGSGIALNFHQSGLEMAYGNNVWVCSNLNIYGQNFVRTYGENSVHRDKMFEVMENWIHKLDDFRKNDLRVIECMQETRVVNGHAVIGLLLEEAVKQAYIDSKHDAPLNIGQCSVFTRNVLKDYKEVLNAPISVYSMQNIASNIIKPHNSGATDLLLQGNSIGRFFTEMLPESFVKELSY